jgi:hypothetical protein
LQRRRHRLCASKNLAQVYGRQVERLQDALDKPEIRDEAIHLLRSLLDRIVIGPVEPGLEVEIVGEIAQIDRNRHAGRQQQERALPQREDGPFGKGGCGDSKPPRPTLVVAI